MVFAFLGIAVLVVFWWFFGIFLGAQPLAKHTQGNAKAHPGKTKAHSGKHAPTNAKARPNKRQSTLSGCALVTVGVCFGTGWGVLSQTLPNHDWFVLGCCKMSECKRKATWNKNYPSKAPWQVSYECIMIPFRSLSDLHWIFFGFFRISLWIYIASLLDIYRILTRSPSDLYWFLLNFYCISFGYLLSSNE